jgi:hypothetical protein
VALISKKEGSQDISNFRPISIIHNIGKILIKVLSYRLTPKLDQLVSNCHSAFGRSIHYFKYVRGAVKHFHEAKTPMLLHKLDIARRSTPGSHDTAWLWTRMEG